MLVVVSPAKKMNTAPVAGCAPTRPAFAAEAGTLAQAARGLTADDLKRLMRISDNLARLNAARFRDFAALAEKPAVLAFAGDTYLGLEAGSLEPDEMAWAQAHLRILSGLYGLLRPLDAIRPHRLGMGSRLTTARRATLYDFWGARIAEALNAQADALGTGVLVNCASREYFAAVAPRALRLRVITPVFMEDRPGGPRVVSLWAKRARGAMARFVIQRRLRDPEALKEFDTGGYRHEPDLSEGDRWVFLRAQEAAA